MSKCITTYSKIKFNPLEPQIEGVSIDDIAHALSLMCRANGHFPTFYSVGQHCVLCCEEALQRGYSPSVTLACLLHDASEAYLADITRPIKPYLSNYLEVEEVLQELIYKKYIPHALSDDDRTKLVSIDNSLLQYEFTHFMNEDLQLPDTYLKTSPDFKFVDFKHIEDRYKELFYSLTQQLADQEV